MGNKKEQWGPYGEELLQATLKCDVEKIGKPSIKVGENALGCVRCHTTTPLEPCVNCGSDSYRLGFNSDRILGLFCDKCNQGFVSWKCSCGCTNPISNETILMKKRMGHCFVVTAACGDFNSPEVVYLSAFRDKVLDRTAFGRCLLNFYYQVSPHLTTTISKSNTLRMIVQIALTIPITEAISAKVSNIQVTTSHSNRSFLTSAISANSFITGRFIYTSKLANRWMQ